MSVGDRLQYKLKIASIPCPVSLLVRYYTTIKKSKKKIF